MVDIALGYHMALRSSLPFNKRVPCKIFYFWKEIDFGVLWFGVLLLCVGRCPKTYFYQNFLPKYTIQAPIFAMKPLLISSGFSFFSLLYSILFLLSYSGFYRFQVKETKFRIVKLERVIIGRVLWPLTEATEELLDAERKWRRLCPSTPFSFPLIFASPFAVLTSFLLLMASLSSGAALSYPSLMSLEKERLLSPLCSISGSQERILALWDRVHVLQTTPSGQGGEVLWFVRPRLNEHTWMGVRRALNLTDSSKPYMGFWEIQFLKRRKGAGRTKGKKMLRHLPLSHILALFSALGLWSLWRQRL